jgi:probable phosphoglycerate mutase
MNTIFLLRHGEIRQSSPRRFVGRSDLPLTATGRAQMASLAGGFAHKGIERIVCSPLSRCVESANILGGGLVEPEICADLREISLGQWEGLTVEEVCRRFPGQYEQRSRDMAGYAPPEGESFEEVRQRVWPAFQRIAEDEKITVIVAHAGVNRVILCGILGMPLANLFRLEQDYACVNILRSDGADFVLEAMNIMCTVFQIDDEFEI